MADDGESARSQTDVVIDGIMHMLTSGDLRPGARLPIEKDLAAQLGVSRGSLREGVRALATLGVLETRQGAGTYVTTLDAATLLGPLGFLTDLQEPAQASHLLAVRRVLEGECAALAAVRLSEHQLDELEGILDAADRADHDLEAFIQADLDFHRLIARATGNPPLAALVEALGGRTFRARLWRAISDRGAVPATQSEHRSILEELRRREPERARIRMAGHLLGVEEFSAAHGDDGAYRDAQ